ncbi:hypothetical protein PAXRUDRAFT_10586 [Paxillus rubicundulus Ve08.2h10]|uniref:Uncharacterized protein n=1 Tax=Paxillus rubicundulus Ve08.2h10 TaxID=930991 RepID=A0A0D0DG28_9AGAM|nr:hypothetical protein PAXRUDRAFT_10586 [Paxillus rubicundulus Ve08.2h10]
MSASTTNDITKWSNEQLRENEDEDEDEKKSAEHRCHMKVWKEVEHQRAEEEVRRKAEEEAKRKAEEEAKRKVEVEAQRRAEGEAKAKVCTEEVVQVQWPGDMQSTRRRKQEELMSPWAGKKKAWMQSPVVDDNDKYDEEADEEVEEEHDPLGALTEVLVVVVMEMWDMATDRRHVAAESHAQMEQMLVILEEI